MCEPEQQLGRVDQKEITRRMRHVLRYVVSEHAKAELRYIQVVETPADEKSPRQSRQEEYAHCPRDSVAALLSRRYVFVEPILHLQYYRGDYQHIALGFAS